MNHALAIPDVGILETTVVEINDSASAKRLLDRIGAAAELGEIPCQDDIAALSALSATQVLGSEFDERLAENSIQMPAGSMNRRLAALAMLRAAAQAHQNVDDRLNGRYVATPPRPDPLVMPLTDSAPQSPHLSEVFDIWVKDSRPQAKTIGHNRLYMQRFIALHGDLPVANITREQVKVFRNLIERLPRNVPPALNGASPQDIAAWAMPIPLCQRSAEQLSTAAPSEQFRHCATRRYERL